MKRATLVGAFFLQSMPAWAASFSFEAVLWHGLGGLFLALTAGLAIWAVCRYKKLKASLEALSLSLASKTNVGAVTDPSMRKIIELFDEERQEKEQAVQDQRQFLFRASHDLRQPMQALGLFVMVLSDQELLPKQKAVIDKIEESLAALDRFINALLDIARLDAGLVEARLAPFCPQTVFERLEREFAPLARQKNLSLRFAPSFQLVVGDEVLIERILRIVLSNAIRFTQKGGIVVGAKKRKDQLLLGVWDSGIGVPQEKTEQLFTEFCSLAREKRGDGQGSGLGLAIAARLAQLSKGEMEYWTQEDKGSMFGVVLPVKREGKINL